MFASLLVSVNTHPHGFLQNIKEGLEVNRESHVIMPGAQQAACMAESRTAEAQQAAQAAAQRAGSAAAQVPAARLAANRAATRAAAAAQHRAEQLESKLQQAEDDRQQLRMQLAQTQVCGAQEDSRW